MEFFRSFGLRLTSSGLQAYVLFGPDQCMHQLVIALHLCYG
jgi:hypothetical protein